jgi:L-seryl-tRNA(Ser) seleniumtransferase
MSAYRDLPAVDTLMQTAAAQGLIDMYGRPLTLGAVRQALDDARAAFPRLQSVPDDAALLQLAAAALHTWSAPTLLPVINATGVVLHTNLGRAPLSAGALQAMQAVAGAYSTLEFDLESGKRGSRALHAEGLLRRLTGAEAALVVNNNAAAVLLILTALARRRAVVISRTQLVEIGGGFRVPDVMKQSGARLVEVGATNRVHLADYEAALAEKPALLLRAHRSNFAMVGFTSEPPLAEVAAVAHGAGLPLVDDLGSGVLLDTARFGLAHEPTVQESLTAGADLVCFSGDKLLGGPQAGLIVGRAAWLAKLRKHPLARAVRADKLALAALSATLLHYLKDEAERAIPVWRMIAAPPEELARRALAWRAALGVGEVIPGQSTIGGGSLPGETQPTFLWAVNAPRANQALARLRRGSPPIIARVQDDLLVFDPRTVLPEQEPAFLSQAAAWLHDSRIPTTNQSKE